MQKMAKIGRKLCKRPQADGCGYCTQGTVCAGRWLPCQDGPGSHYASERPRGCTAIVCQNQGGLQVFSGCFRQARQRLTPQTRIQKIASCCTKKTHKLYGHTTPHHTQKPPCPCRHYAHTPSVFRTNLLWYSSVLPARDYRQTHRFSGDRRPIGGGLLSRSVACAGGMHPNQGGR